MFYICRCDPLQHMAARELYISYRDGLNLFLTFGGYLMQDDNAVSVQNLRYSIVEQVGPHMALSHPVSVQSRTIRVTAYELLHMRDSYIPSILQELIPVAPYAGTPLSHKCAVMCDLLGIAEC